MAEALLRAMAGEHFEAHSAGTEPKSSILPEVQEVMREVGIDISGQSPKSVSEYLGKTIFAHVITVCADAEEKCPAIFLNMGTHEHFPFEDPAKADETQRLETSRRVRDQIEERLRLWLTEQNVTPKPLHN